MKRNNITPRKNWVESVEEDGLIWHTADGKPYWDESVYYSFTPKQIAQIEEATVRVHNVFIEATEHVLETGQLHKFNIPAYAHDAIIRSWDKDHMGINYGRFDFGYDGVNPPKLFEYNADTPTSLLEASTVQWNWKQDQFKDNDQFNGIHEALVRRWNTVLRRFKPEFVHCAHVWDDYGEDTLNVSYMRDIIKEAGGHTIPMLISDLGFDYSNYEFVDLENYPIQMMYKLYPWEWLLNEEVGKHIVNSNSTIWLEPLWKAIWSNKAILPFLWEVAPEHPNLLGASFDKPEGVGNYVKKPILAREGANIEVVKDNSVIAKSSGEYSEGPCVYQELFAIPEFDTGRFPIIGSWCVDGYSVGMGIREDGLITGNSARFIPHIID